MASPFKLLKKHERELMVIMTGIAMFCFVILDSVTSGRRDGSSNPFVLPLIFAAIGAGAAWIHGQVAKKSANYWLNGLALGAVAGAAVVFFSMRSEEGVNTSFGKISFQELRGMQQNRTYANQVIDLAVMARDIPESQFSGQLIGMARQEFLFGSATPRDVLANRLLIKEADRLNIQVSDEQVRQYLKDASDKKLTGQQFDEICRRVGLSDVTIFDILREELRARTAYRVLSAEVVYLPEQYWQDFQKFNVKHSIDATALPVEAFTKAVEAPQEGQLKALFEEFKAKPPFGDQPGFRQPDRKRMAYFAAEVETLEKAIGEPKEEELKALYEARKETSFKETTLPELPFGELDKTGKPDASGPAKPDDKPKTEDKAKSEDKPGEPSKTEDKPKEEKPKTEEPKSNDPAKPDAAKPADSKEATPEKKADEDKKSTDGGADCGAEDPKPADKAQAEDKPKAETKAETTDPKKEPAGEKPAQTEPAEPAKTPDSEKADPAKEPADKTEPAAKGPPAKYKPFDDVKDQLRDMWLSEKVRALSKERLDASALFLDGVRIDYLGKGGDISKEEFAKEVATKAGEYAQKHGLTYAETPLLDFKEFSESKDIPLAQAKEPFDINSIDFSNLRSIPQPKPIPQLVFGGATSLFIPMAAEGGASDKNFVFWITQDAPEHEPKFDDPGIREQVEKAWRIKEARPRAEKRATELVELVSKDLGPGKAGTLAQSLNEQTVTGEKEALQLSVITSAPFTWLRQSFAGLQMNPFAGRQIELGTIPGIDAIDNNFMQTIAGMKLGEVKVIPNGDKSAYYVVHLKDRTPASGEGATDVASQQQFINEHPQMMMSGIHRSMASGAFGEVQGRWIDELMRKYAVDLSALNSSQSESE